MFGKSGCAVRGDGTGGVGAFCDETTVEGVHPNNWGMMHVGQALGELLKRVVK